MDNQQDYVNVNVKVKKLYIEVTFGIAIGVVSLLLSLFTNSFIDYRTYEHVGENSFLSLVSSFLFVVGAFAIVTSIVYGIQKGTLKMQKIHIRTKKNHEEQKELEPLPDSD